MRTFLRLLAIFVGILVIFNVGLLAGAIVMIVLVLLAGRKE